MAATQADIVEVSRKAPEAAVEELADVPLAVACGKGRLQEASGLSPDLGGRGGGEETEWRRRRWVVEMGNGLVAQFHEMAITPLARLAVPSCPRICRGGGERVKSPP